MLEAVIYDYIFLGNSIVFGSIFFLSAIPSSIFNQAYFLLSGLSAYLPSVPRISMAGVEAARGRRGLPPDDQRYAPWLASIPSQRFLFLGQTSKTEKQTKI
mgnify:CR=1 FL=1